MYIGFSLNNFFLGSFALEESLNISRKFNKKIIRTLPQFLLQVCTELSFTAYEADSSFQGLEKIYLFQRQFHRHQFAEELYNT
jgi:hypothetical protein